MFFLHVPHTQVTKNVKSDIFVCETSTFPEAGGRCGQKHMVRWVSVPRCCREPLSYFEISLGTDHCWLYLLIAWSELLLRMSVTFIYHQFLSVDSRLRKATDLGVFHVGNFLVRKKTIGYLQVIKSSQEILFIVRDFSRKWMQLPKTTRSRQ